MGPWKSGCRFLKNRGITTPQPPKLYLATLPVTWKQKDVLPIPSMEVPEKMAFELSILSTGPKIVSDGRGLRARCSVWQGLSCGFLFWRSLKIDRQRRTLTIFHLDFWLIPQKWVVSYHDIRDINYKYRDYGFLRSLNYARNSLDCYTVSIELQNYRVIDLFWWYGEGEFLNESILPDWVFWQQYAFDTKGSQKRESLQFYEMLREEIFRERQPGSINMPRAGRLKP